MLVELGAQFRPPGEDELVSYDSFQKYLESEPTLPKWVKESFAESILAPSSVDDFYDTLEIANPAFQRTDNQWDVTAGGSGFFASSDFYTSQLLIQSSQIPERDSSPVSTANLESPHIPEETVPVEGLGLVVSGSPIPHENPRFVSQITRDEFETAAREMLELNATTSPSDDDIAMLGEAMDRLDGSLDGEIGEYDLGAGQVAAYMVSGLNQGYTMVDALTLLGNQENLTPAENDFFCEIANGCQAALLQMQDAGILTIDIPWNQQTDWRWQILGVLGQEMAADQSGYSGAAFNVEEAFTDLAGIMEMADVSGVTFGDAYQAYMDHAESTWQSRMERQERLVSTWEGLPAEGGNRLSLSDNRIEINAKPTNVDDLIRAVGKKDPDAVSAALKNLPVVQIDGAGAEIQCFRWRTAGETGPTPYLVVESRDHAFKMNGQTYSHPGVYVFDSEGRYQFALEDETRTLSYKDGPETAVVKSRNNLELFTAGKLMAQADIYRTRGDKEGYKQAMMELGDEFRGVKKGGFSAYGAAQVVYEDLMDPMGLGDADARAALIDMQGAGGKVAWNDVMNPEWWSEVFNPADATQDFVSREAVTGVALMVGAGEVGLTARFLGEAGLTALARRMTVDTVAKRTMHRILTSKATHAVSGNLLMAYGINGTMATVNYGRTGQPGYEGVQAFLVQGARLALEMYAAGRIGKGTTGALAGPEAGAVRRLAAGATGLTAESAAFTGVGAAFSHTETFRREGETPVGLQQLDDAFISSTVFILELRAAKGLLNVSTGGKYDEVVRDIQQRLEMERARVAEATARGQRLPPDQIPELRTLLESIDKNDPALSKAVDDIIAEVDKNTALFGERPAGDILDAAPERVAFPSSEVEGTLAPQPRVAPSRTLGPQGATAVGGASRPAASVVPTPVEVRGGAEIVEGGPEVERFMDGLEREAAPTGRVALPRTQFPPGTAARIDATIPGAPERTGVPTVPGAGAREVAPPPRSEPFLRGAARSEPYQTPPERVSAEFGGPLNRLSTLAQLETPISYRIATMEPYPLTRDTALRVVDDVVFGTKSREEIRQEGSAYLREQAGARADTVPWEFRLAGAGDPIEGIDSMTDIALVARRAGIVDVPGGYSRSQLGEILGDLHITGSPDVRIDGMELDHVPKVVAGTLDAYAFLTSGSEPTPSELKVAHLVATTHDVAKANPNLSTRNGYTILPDASFNGIPLNNTGKPVRIPANMTIDQAIEHLKGEGVIVEQVPVLTSFRFLLGAMLHPDAVQTSSYISELQSRGVLTAEEAGMAQEAVLMHMFDSTWVARNSETGLGIQSGMFAESADPYLAKRAQFARDYRGHVERMVAENLLPEEYTAKYPETMSEFHQRFETLFRAPVQRAIILGDIDGQNVLGKWMLIHSGKPSVKKMPVDSAGEPLSAEAIQELTTRGEAIPTRSMTVYEMIVGESLNGNPIPSRTEDSVDGSWMTSTYEQRTLSPEYGAMAGEKFEASRAWIRAPEGEEGLAQVLLARMNGFPGMKASYEKFQTDHAGEADVSVLRWLDSVPVYEGGVKNPVFNDIMAAGNTGFEARTAPEVRVPEVVPVPVAPEALPMAVGAEGRSFVDPFAHLEPGFELTGVEKARQERADAIGKGDVWDSSFDEGAVLSVYDQGVRRELIVRGPELKYRDASGEEREALKEGTWLLRDGEGKPVGLFDNGRVVIGFESPADREMLAVMETLSIVGDAVRLAQTTEAKPAYVPVGGNRDVVPTDMTPSLAVLAELQSKFGPTISEHPSIQSEVSRLEQEIRTLTGEAVGEKAREAE